jgi:hypothetical protein
MWEIGRPLRRVRKQLMYTWLKRISEAKVYQLTPHLFPLGVLQHMETFERAAVMIRSSTRYEQLKSWAITRLLSEFRGESQAELSTPGYYGVPECPIVSSLGEVGQEDPFRQVLSQMWDEAMRPLIVLLKRNSVKAESVS